MVSGLSYVAEEGGRGGDIVEDYVDMAIVEKVAEGCPAGAENGGEAAARGGGDLLEFLAVEIAEKQRPLGVGGAPVGLVSNGIDVVVGDEQVEKPVIIEIEKASAPAKKRNRGQAETGAKGHVGKGGIAIVAVESLVVVGKGSDEEV